MSRPNSKKKNAYGRTATTTSAKSDSASLQHASYIAPPDYDTRGLVNILHEYLDKTGLEKNFSELLHILLNSPKLPFNPYPSFVTHLRPYAERFFMYADSDDHIDTVTTVPLRETALLNLYTVKERGGVWGLKSLLRTVNVHSVQKYQWMLNDLTPKRDNLFITEGYSIQVMVALVGGAIFHGTFYSQCHIVQLRVEYLVTGSEVAEGIAIFINSVMMDIDALQQSNTHVLLGVSVPVESEDDVWVLEFWDSQEITTEKARLLQKMSHAVAGSKYILAEGVFRSDPTQKSFIRGQKQYSLNFITVVEDNLKEEGLMSFAEFPLGSLHEGVFLNQMQAEAYTHIFSLQTNYADVENIRHESAKPASSSSVRAKVGELKRPTMTYEDDRALVHRHVHVREEMLKPTKIRIDGFRTGNDSGFGPFAWQVTSPIKSSLQSRISRFHPQAQLFDIVYHSLLLVLMDRSSYNPELIHELYRLCHSTAGRLHLLNEQNKSLRAVVKGLAEVDEMQFIRIMLTLYRDNLDELLVHSVQDRSNELVMVGRSMVAEVDQLLAPSDRDFSSVTHIDHIIAKLRSIQHFSMPLLLQLSEDALHWCPELKDFINKLRQIFPEEVLRPSTHYSDTKTFRSNQENRHFLKTSDLIKHDTGNEWILNQEHYVIDIEVCSKKENVPKAMAIENVLLKYVIDTHLDEVWHGFLVNLFPDIQQLPNPYPRFLSLMRGCAMRMSFCQERESRLEHQLMKNHLQLVDTDNYIFQLPGCHAFGPETSLRMVDTGMFELLYHSVQESLVNKNYIHRKGPYKVGICLGMSALSTLCSKLTPCLHSIELQEHYYIQGPSGCQADAVQLFSRMVQAHLAELIESSGFPVMGAVLGFEKMRWSWESIINERHSFWLELEVTCARKEPVYMQAYLQMDKGHYVMVQKYFLLHFISDDYIEKIRFYPYSPVQFYETVFFSKERAAFHYQNDGVPTGGNPCSVSNCRTVNQRLDDNITQAYNKADWFQLFRYILLKALLSKEGVCPAACEAWRLFNSWAGQAAYAAAFCSALEDMVLLAIEYNHFSGKPLALTDQNEPTQSAADCNSVVSKLSNLNPLDMGVVNKMTAAFIQKTQQLATMHGSMLASSMGDYVMGKIKPITKEDPASREILLVIEHETINTLEELRQIFLSVAAMIGGDVYNMCCYMQEVVKAAKEQITERPSSVNSNVLVDPDFYKKSRPRAHKKILDDEMLYAYKL